MELNKVRLCGRIEELDNKSAINLGAIIATISLDKNHKKKVLFPIQADGNLKIGSYCSYTTNIFGNCANIGSNNYKIAEEIVYRN